MAYVKRETGYWQYSKLRGIFGYACSICHTKFSEKDYKNVEDFNFCPECGSRMVERINSDNKRSKKNSEG